MADDLPPGYELDDDVTRIDVDAVWHFLSTEAYWSRWRSRADFEGQLASAWRVVGAYAADGAQVAFARAWSDGVTCAYLGDVFVLPAHRGRGLGVAVVRAMIEDGPGAGLRWLLHTGDAHGLYRRFGFAPPARLYLERPRPPVVDDPWELEVAAVWAGAEGSTDDEVVARIEDLAGRRPGSAPALFELASAYDYVGREPEAAPLYRAAIDAGLDDARQPRAALQLGSTLRNLGRPDDALELLRAPQPEPFGDAQAAFTALALLDAGREREAALTALRALAGRLPVYGRAVGAYVDKLDDELDDEFDGAGQSSDS